ncbi:MAG: hypothetical protein WBX27_09010 [Specibacter sp.]
MNSRKLAAVTLAAVMSGSLGMSGCASSTGGATNSGTSSAQPQESESTALLLLNDSLKEKLGAAYSDAWIEGNKLHVAVTTKDAEKTVTDAGAVPLLVSINAAQLEATVQAISAWQARLPVALGAAIHQIIPDGRTGTVTIFVAPDQLDAVTKAAANDKPAGTVPLVIKESPGLATPL